MRAGAEPGQGRAMHRRGVAHMAGKAIAGPARVQPGHRAVAQHLGQDGGGGDGEGEAIAAYQAGRGAGGLGGGAIAVDQRQIGRRWQAQYGAAHGEVGGAQNIQPADLAGRGGGHGIFGDAGSPCRNQGGEGLLALSGGERLAVIEQGGQGRGHALGEDHGGGHDGAGQGAAPGLIHPCHPAAGGGFMGKISHGAAADTPGPAGRGRERAGIGRG